LVLVVVVAAGLLMLILLLLLLAEVKVGGVDDDVKLGTDADDAVSGRLVVEQIEVHRAGMFHNSPRILTLSMRKIKIAAHDTSTK